jgi:hypothetical protein
MRFLGTIVFCLAAASIHAASTSNDDSCDVAVMPAATLLLPYFEVDLISAAGTGETTIFTVTNMSNLSQAVQVTLWTDYDYPVMTFNIFLTGYDVQSINLYDVLVRGQIAPDQGTGYGESNVGELSGDFVEDIPFDNPLLAEETCVDLPLKLPAALITRMQSAFTTGKVPGAGTLGQCNTAGGVHGNAVGYATIDVVGACDPRLPTNPAYYFDVIRFDNVLGGDYMQINGNEDFAQGNSMVHIRAIPEGGRGRTRLLYEKYTVDLERTFYSRFQDPAAPKLDARQPLPSTFAARWISGGATGFETYYKIWRETRTASDTVCSAFPARGGANDIVETVRFDEEENPEILRPNILVLPIANRPTLPATSLTDVENEVIFPRTTTGAVAGWTYLNLDYAENDGIASQNWVVSSMRAEDRFSVDIDALALGNGCSAPAELSQAHDASGVIGPAPNVRP